MAQIILRVTKGPDAGKVFTFEQAPIKIGRARMNDVYINDTTVSGFHATIIYKDGNLVIQDHSKNGTYVNGKRVKESVLADGDEIIIGLSGLRFTMESGRETVVSGEATKVKESDETVRKEGVSLVRKVAKKKIRPIMLVLPLVLIILGVVYLLSSNQPSGEKPSAGQLTAPEKKNERPLVNIGQEWIRLDTGNIADKKVRGDLRSGKERYDDKKKHPENLYKAIKKWKETLTLLDSARQKTLEGIIYTAEKELEEDIKKVEGDAELLLKQKKYKESAELWDRITRMIPDPTNSYYQEAKRVLARYGLSKHLQSGQR